MGRGNNHFLLLYLYQLHPHLGQCGFHRRHVPCKWGHWVIIISYSKEYTARCNYVVSGMGVHIIDSSRKPALVMDANLAILPPRRGTKLSEAVAGRGCEGSRHKSVILTMKFVFIPYMSSCHFRPGIFFAGYPDGGVLLVKVVVHLVSASW